MNTLGLPHTIHITPANVTDWKEMIDLNINSLSTVKIFLVYGGYSGNKFADTIKKIHGVTVKLVKRNELHQFGILPKLWIVERSFSWLEKHRRLWKNCERYLHTSIQMTSLAFIALLLNKF